MTRRTAPSESGENALSETEEARLDEIDAAFRYSEGDVIGGKYRLTQSLGVGGMGEVWKAHNDVLDSDVALKLVRGDVENPLAGDRLLREARAAARLGHPAIVRIFDYGTAEGGEPYIVMELLEGEDLSSSLERHGRMSATRSVRTILPIAHALAAAHAKGIVHRDIKPENIFLARIEGDNLQPKIVDFGIAQLDHSLNLRLTRTGAVIGTPSYMSPEQARGEASDHRADVWSLCVVLYEMVTGRLPFDGKNANALLHAIIVNEAPAITTFGTGDPELWSILSRGLTKNPDERFQSMEELGRALASWLLSKNVTEDVTGTALQATWFRGPARPSSLPPPPNDPPASTGSGDETTQIAEAKPTRRLPIALAIGVALAAGALFGLRSSTDSAPAEPSSTTSVAPAVPIAQEVASAVAASAAPLPAASTPTEVTAPAASKSATDAPARTWTAPAPKKPRILKDPFH